MKKKISTVLAVSMIATNISPVLNVYANEVVKEKAKLIEEKVISEAKVKNFDLKDYSNFEGYNSKYRVLRDEIKSISNNGGNYGSSSIDKAIDGNLSTHWETGKSNSSDFKNEVVVEFNDIEIIDRIAYATRQDGAKGKGFPTQFEVYSSITGNDEDFTLVSQGSHASTGNMMEFKFDTINTKKVKFVFKEANQGWASASEFWFYREDTQLDKMDKIFTDDTRTTVSEEFNSLDKLSIFEEEVKSHPFYENIVEDLNDAKLILEGKTVVYKDAIVSKFKKLGSAELVKYDELFKVQPNKITTNGGHYGSSNIEKAIDGKADTSWHSGKQNSSNFTNEVILTLDEITKLDRIVYTAGAGTQRGFAEMFDIYASKTSKGDAFELVSKGSSSRTNDSIEIKFNPTEFKRVKFVFKKGYENWALASEFGLYKQDTVADKMGRLFTDNTMSTVSEEFNNLDKLEVLSNEAKDHPFYNEYKEKLLNAKLIVEGNEVEYADAVVRTFKNFNDEALTEYNKLFKLNTSKITANGGHYGSSNIEKAMDNNLDTSWHSGKQNSSDFTNEVIITLDKLEVLDRVVYTSLNSRGFAKAFDIYMSKTSEGNTFEKVTSGKHNITKDSIEIKFNPTEAKRVKFVFKEGYENWALASEFALYKKDEIKDKLDKIFIDDNMSSVSEEFNTLDKLEILENEAKNHPFFSDYTEDFVVAKELIEAGQIIESRYDITKFKPYYTGAIEEYDKVYRLPISTISNNGGNYGGDVISKAIDNDVNSHWETSKPNSNDFNNEVILTLENAEVINRLTYKSRNSGKGFATDFDILVSPTDKGNNFVKVTNGKHAVTENILEIKFNLVKAKRVKFVFNKAHDSWASISDIRVYKKDAISEKMDGLFTNGLMNEVAEEYRDKNVLSSLKQDINDHPLNEEFSDLIKRAEKILDETLEVTRTVVAEQHGNMEKHAQQNLQFGFGNNNQATGVYALPGETITVYVDADVNGPLPRLMFSQQEGSFANWGRGISLSPGKNIIKVPEVPTDNWYNHEVTKGGPVYIVNPYTKEEQPKVPVIRFENAHKFPLLTEDTNNEEFIKELKEYKKAIDADKEANPKVSDRKVIDTFEFVSKHILFTGTASGAYEAYVTRGITPTRTVTSWNEYMTELMRYYGLDGNNIYDDPKYIRDNVRLAQPFGYMYAAGGHIGVQGDVMTSLLVPFEDDKGSNWGITHEIGHKMDVQKRLYGESTNNMLPLYMDNFYGKKPGNSVPYNKIYKNIMSENSNVYVSGDYFERIAPFWQLELYHPNYWGELNSLYRERNKDIHITDGEVSKTKYIVEFSSEILGVDLSEYFARHGFPVSDEVRKNMANKYEKPDKKLWYINDGLVRYKGNGFVGGVETKVSSTNQDGKIKLNFDTSDNGDNDLLGYEILKNGEVIGFTNNKSFVDENTNLEQNEVYTVITYDRKLNTLNPVELNSYAPSITTSNGLTLKLNEKFNPRDYMKALNYKGENISSNVEIEHNVDATKKGNYEIIYTVTSDGITVTSILPVSVVSDYDYLSDKEWKSVQTQHGTPRRNSNIKGRVNGEIKTFEKGFGIHANGKIVYDLSNVEYDNFEALLGIDMNIEEQNNSSITFKIVGDGKTLATTKVIKHEDNMVRINVPVNGVQELVIEVNDGGNGRTSDHSVIANPKLTTNNSKPKLSVTDKAYKIGEKVDFAEGISAVDVEDGDLTNSIEVISNNYEENKVGRFEVIYKVTDSDENSVEKKSYITVYEDFVVKKSKYGQFDNLASYNEEFKIPVVSVSNNGGRYSNSVIENSIDNNMNTHWETGKANSSSFENEVIFDLGEVNEVDKIAYAARRGGKGFASKFEIYVSNEAEGDGFVLAGKGEYKGSSNDVIEFKISNNNARRVKLKFIEANQGWASIGEMSFYKKDSLSDKINNDLFTDNTKTEVSETYNTLEKLENLRKEVSNHAASELFQTDLNKAEEIIRAKFPTISFTNSLVTKIGENLDINTGYIATDQEDGDITSSVKVEGNVNFNKSGKYEITYSVSDSDGNTTTAVREAKVVNMNDFKYLSDIDWKSVHNTYGSATKDISASGRTLRLTDENGAEVSYEKGIGTHSTSTIKYDLTKDDYGYFTSFVGVDRQMFGTVGSVTFEVYLDDEKVYDSGLINSRDAQKYVEVNLKDAKELKLVVTDGRNGNGSDHANWADAKLHFAKEEVVNYEELVNIINSTKELKDYLYTIDTWNALETVINKAKSGIENQNIGQIEVDELVDEIQTAIANLIEREDKKKLQELLNYADTIEKSMVGAGKFVEQRWENFLIYREVSREELLDKNKTEEDSNTAIFTLNYFIDELELK